MANGVDDRQAEQISNLQGAARRRENVTIGVAVFGTVIALAAAVISYLQWSVMREQLADARRGAAEANEITQRMLRSTEAQANSMRQLAGSTTDLEKATEKSLVWAQRAWVHCDSVTSDPAALDGGNSPIIGKRIKLTFMLTNNGRSPAERLSIEAVGEIVPIGKIPNLEKKHEVIVQRTAMIPNSGELVATTDLITEFGSSRGVGALTDELIYDIATGKKRVFAFGRMSFSDVFGSRHWLRFCFYFKAGYGWTRYERGNDEGDGAPPW